jgi:hypothetical protein
MDFILKLLQCVAVSLALQYKVRLFLKKLRFLLCQLLLRLLPLLVRLRQFGLQILVGGA